MAVSVSKCTSRHKEPTKLVCLCSSQYTYENFGRYFYNIRQCAATDLGTKTWLAMHCDAELDWICKIPRGNLASNHANFDIDSNAMLMLTLMVWYP